MPRSVSFFLILQPFWLDVKQAGIYILLFFFVDQCFKSCVSAGLSLDYASAGNLHSNLQQNQKLLQNAMLQPFT